MKIRKLRSRINKDLRVLEKIESEKLNELDKQIREILKDKQKNIQGKLTEELWSGNKVYELEYPALYPEKDRGVIMEVIINNTKNNDHVEINALRMYDKQKWEKNFTLVKRRSLKEPNKYTIDTLNKFIDKLDSVQRNRLIVHQNREL